MRRPIRPFTIERKRSGRSAPASETTLAERPMLPEPPPEKPSPAPRWAAAEALFSTPKAQEPEAAAEVSASTSGAQTQSGRILPNLLEPPAPTPSFAVEDAPPPRRGRKPGSRNKTTSVDPSKQGPKTIENVMRNLFDFWVREDEPPAPAPPEAVASADAAMRLGLQRRGRTPREDLPRGERWKARLPRFARH